MAPTDVILQSLRLKGESFQEKKKEKNNICQYNKHS